MQTNIFSDVNEVKNSNDKIAAELALKRLNKELDEVTAGKRAVEASIEARTNGDALAFLLSCGIGLLFACGVYGTWKTLIPSATDFGPALWAAVFFLVLIPTIAAMIRNRQTKQHILGVQLLSKEFETKINQLRREMHKHRKIVEN
jgi:hypothetical protein